MSVLKAFFAEAFRRPCSKCLFSTVDDFYKTQLQRPNGVLMHI